MCAASVPPSPAIELRGSVQTQNIVRHPDVGEFHFIQQRNTLRLGAHWAAPEPERPVRLDEASFTILYRGVSATCHAASGMR